MQIEAEQVGCCPLILHLIEQTPHVLCISSKERFFTFFLIQVISLQFCPNQRTSPAGGHASFMWRGDSQGLDTEDAEECVVCSPGRRAAFISPITFPNMHSLNDDKQQGAAKPAAASTYFFDFIASLVWTQSNNSRGHGSS